jgi:hypothetical protein
MYVTNPTEWTDPLGLASGPASRKNSKGQWVDKNGKFAKKPPRPVYTSESSCHEAGIPGSTKGYHGCGTPNPIGKDGTVVEKSKFSKGEGGAPFANEVYDHHNVQAAQQSNGRWKYEVSDMGRVTGTNTSGNSVRGGRVIVEGNPPVTPGSYNPNDVVTQFPI